MDENRQSWPETFAGATAALFLVTTIGVPVMTAPKYAEIVQRQLGQSTQPTASIAQIDLTATGWNCNSFGFMEFRSDGQVILRSPMNDGTGPSPVDRTRSESTGTFSLVDEELQLRITHQRTIAGSASDIAILGELADFHFDSLRVLKVIPKANYFTFTQTRRTYNGKEKKSNPSIVVCKPVPFGTY